MPSSPPVLPTDATSRKSAPIARGVLDYFPLAIAEIARCSLTGSEQHQPGEPMRWAREKSDDHADCAIRHFMERGTVDTDGRRHLGKAAWRILALLQIELENEAELSKRPVLHPLAGCDCLACVAKRLEPTIKKFRKDNPELVNKTPPPDPSVRVCIHGRPHSTYCPLCRC